MEDKFQELFSGFSAYKSKIPVFGCIMLNSKMNKFVLVRDYNSKSWMFPRGKINENESEFTCAIREVIEEVGFDPSPHCKEEDNLLIFQDGKIVKLFIATNVAENTEFNTQTRKEISAIEFHGIDAVPKNSYGVLPFIPKLKRWISKHSRGVQTKSPSLNGRNKTPTPHALLMNSMKKGSVPAPANKKMTVTAILSKTQTNPTRNHGSNSAAHPSPGTMKRLRNLFDQRNTDTFSSDSEKGWGVTDMFAANSKITGLNYNYNGNPHDFGSSHPKFVDYRSITPNSRSLITGGGGIADESLLELHELSRQSLMGHKLMRLERGKDDIPEDGVGDHRLPPEFSLPRSEFSQSLQQKAHSVLSAIQLRPSPTPQQFSGSLSGVADAPYRWSSARFTFALDKAEALAAMDSVLQRTQQYIC